MATKTHQLILGLVVRAMRSDGFDIQNIDGTYPGMFGQKLPLPPKIVNHRPDIFGVNGKGQICIGEAKTKNDIQVPRTETQMQDYVSAELNGMECAVYLGAPQSAKELIENLFRKLGITENGNVKVILVPDELVNE